MLFFKLLSQLCSSSILDINFEAIRIHKKADGCKNINEIKSSNLNPICMENVIYTNTEE